jgi:hypothetical protein
MYKESSVDEFEFCSQRFAFSTASPLNWAKMLYRLLSHKVLDEELVTQFEYEMRHSSLFAPVMSYIYKKVGLLNIRKLSENAHTPKKSQEQEVSGAVNGCSEVHSSRRRHKGQKTGA